MLEVIIDAHHHFWSSHPILPAEFGPDELAHEIRAAGIDKTILIQSADEPAENDRLAEHATSEFVAGVVQWLPLWNAELALTEFRRVGIDKLCGVRCVVERDPLEWLKGQESIRLLEKISERALVWDIVPITEAQIEAILRLAHTIPGLRITVGHLSRPPLDRSRWQQWARSIEKLAECPNVALKVSVGLDLLTSHKRWPGDELLPYVEWAAAQFGASRLMAASNWPVVLLQANYQQAWGDIRAAVEKIFPHENERQLVLGGTAEHWYRLRAEPVKKDH